MSFFWNLVDNYSLQNNYKIGITATKASHCEKKTHISVTEYQFNSILMSQVLPLWTYGYYKYHPDKDQESTGQAFCQGAVPLASYGHSANLLLRAKKIKNIYVDLAIHVFHNKASSAVFSAQEH